MSAALLLVAAVQPPSLPDLFAPRPGTYGWVEELAGSCFAGNGSYGTRTEHCFSVRDGRFLIASLYRHPRFENRHECTLETAFGDGALRFDCRRNGRGKYEKISRYEGEALVFRDLSDRMAMEPAHRRSRQIWRRLDPDRISVSLEIAERNGEWRPSPFAQPHILTRTERRGR